MNQFTYSYPTRVYFGDDAFSTMMKAEVEKMGSVVMLAYGRGSLKKTGLYEMIVDALQQAGKKVVDFGGIMPNPTYAKVKEGIALAKREHVEFILAAGGGSVLDCSKVISAGAKSDQDMWDLQYHQHQMPTEFLPMGAVVTAFGTGAEMNNGAVITNEETRQKSPLFGSYYSFAVLSPAFTMTMPMGQVISGAFDSLSHCMETYMGSPREENVSDEINEAVQRNIIRNIRKILQNPENEDVRSELIWDAAMSENGMLKIGKKTDFQCHMLEHQLGAYTNCNHGRGLAVLHPVLYKHYLPEAEKQFARLAVNVWGIDPAGKSEAELASAFIQALQDFIKEIGLPTSLHEMNINLSEKETEEIAESTVLTGGCVKKFTAEELQKVLNECA
ncbi:MAG: iron-containing alcohol dehydrogenase [Lactimicrobium sp.]|jgi:alcohol dehydrogenase YqhD (iron-dependent ADH family)|uniref:iron-containing alcohol dehydrogenase n=1 Tax=Lactimicrobium sp. TaxID=2563780 RepID=UPI002F35A937